MNKVVSLYRRREVYRIKVVKEAVDDDFRYKTGIKFLGMTFREEGFYKYQRYTFRGDPWKYIPTEEIDTDKYRIKGHTVIELAHVRLYTKKDVVTTWFNSNDDARKYADEIASKGDWIEVIQED